MVEKSKSESISAEYVKFWLKHQGKALLTCYDLKLKCRLIMFSHLVFCSNLFQKRIRTKNTGREGIRIMLQLSVHVRRDALKRIR